MLCRIVLTQQPAMYCAEIMPLHAICAETGQRRLQTLDATCRHQMRLSQSLGFSLTVQLNLLPYARRYPPGESTNVGVGGNVLTAASNKSTRPVPESSGRREQRAMMKDLESMKFPPSLRLRTVAQDAARVPNRAFDTATHFHDNC